MTPIRVKPPSGLPVSLDELKKAANVDFPDDDLLLETYLKAAVEYLDGWNGILGRAILKQTYELTISELCGRLIDIPFSPISDVAITYPRDGNVCTVSTDDYRIVATVNGTEIYLNQTELLLVPLTVTFTTGFGDDAKDVPNAIKVAILLLACHWYEHREATTSTVQTKLPFAVDALIAPYRRICY